MMNLRNARHSTAFKAVIAGLTFALVYVGLEFSRGIPQRVAIGGDSNAISVFHFPVIWLLAGIMFYGVFYTARVFGEGKVRERRISVGVSSLVAVLLALYWCLPMVGGLYDGLTRPTALRDETLRDETESASTPSVEMPDMPDMPGMPGTPGTPVRPVRPVTPALAAIIRYSKDGFRPAAVIITRGDSVRLVATEGSPMSLVSDYSVLNQKEARSEYLFTFNELGEFVYSNQDSPTHVGTVTVRDASKFLGFHLIVACLAIGVMCYAACRKYRRKVALATR